MRPLPVEDLRAILISPLSDSNYVNLLWRTNCESDVRRYEIHRSTELRFSPDESSRIGVAEDKEDGRYDHQMWQDRNVKPGQTYYYFICAVDAAGQRGEFSGLASVRMKD
ncbi:MAG: fibronectin type III domain-containing protein [Candidatus Sumerlaeota bacterium]|nr:fibronectin type III domain-containing protein [Candidatus Sumerlaeota bacterium]